MLDYFDVLFPYRSQKSSSRTQRAWWRQPATHQISLRLKTCIIASQHLQPYLLLISTRIPPLLHHYRCRWRLPTSGSKARRNLAGLNKIQHQLLNLTEIHTSKYKRLEHDKHYYLSPPSSNRSCQEGCSGLVDQGSRARAVDALVLLEICHAPRFPRSNV